METPTAIPELSPRNVRKLLWSRRTQAIGGVLLAASFFMPAVESCNSPVIPAEDVYSFMREPSLNIAEWFFVFPVFMAAYLFGLATCVVMFRLRSTTIGGNNTAGRSISALSGATTIAIVAMFVNEWSLSFLARFLDVVFVVAWIAFGLYWLRSLWKDVRGRLCIRWCAAVYCVLWFGTHALESKTYYGLWISLAGSIMIAVASILEAQILSGRGILSTLGRLLICRLELVDFGGPHCRTCDYVLVGLTSNRCPECGTLFE